MSLNKTLIVEGVHMDSKFIFKMLNKYKKACIPFLISVEDQKMHKLRFKGRNQQMSLDPSLNKYIKNYKNIQ